MVFVKVFFAVLILAAYFAGMFEGHAIPGGAGRAIAMEFSSER